MLRLKLYKDDGTILTNPNDFMAAARHPKAAFILTEGVRTKTTNFRQYAFTLAEVLITLAIVGIVAAMTIPIIIQKFKNMEIENKLKKVYSTMNQAILMSEIENGPKELWPSKCTDEEDCTEYYNKYILKYIRYQKTYGIESYGGWNQLIYFSDGSLLIGKAAYDYFFFPYAKNFDESTFYTYDENNQLVREGSGKTYFIFRIDPSVNTEINKFHYQKGFEPYKRYLSELTEDELRNGTLYGCNTDNTNPGYCAAWIQYNNWKIPKDYPFKLK